MYPLINDKLRESNYKVSLVVTGGGASCIDNILKYGGASSTLIDSYVPYDTATMDNYLGFEPDKYCSQETSRSLAMEAFKRGSKYNDSEWTLGIGVTCKLEKIVNEREGREHAIYIAVQGLTFSKTYTIIIGPTATTVRNKNIGRIAEEKLAGDCVIMAIADSFGYHQYGEMLNDTFGKDLTITNAIGTVKIGNLCLGNINELKYHDKEPANCIFSGSFNPIHESHLEMIAHAKELYGSVDLELPIMNAEKGLVGYNDLIHRIELINRHIRQGLVNNLILTRYPTFYVKSQHFKNTIFVVGGDTFNRMDEDHFYGGGGIGCLRKQLLFEEMDENGTKFLVFKRKGTTPTANTQSLLDMCTFVTDEEYIDQGISSSQIRKEIEEQQKKQKEEGL